MATRYTLDPGSAHFPSANFPQFGLVNTTERRSVLLFDASTQETCAWVIVLPQGWTGPGYAIVSYTMVSATSGGVAWEALIEAVTAGDATNLASATSYDSANVATGTVPGTAGHMQQITITLTNIDSAAAGDLVRIAIRRAPANGSDTATGDAALHAVEIRDSA